jgi:hypothetical protein
VCRNLKAAKELGMETIREYCFIYIFFRLLVGLLSLCVDVPIGGTFQAVQALEKKLGIDLTSSSSKL